MSRMTKQDKNALLKNYILPGICFLSPLMGSIGYVPFILVCLYIFVELTFEGFMRQDRFGLSLNHPFLNRVFSLAILLLPFTVFLFSFGAFLFMPILLGLYIFSELRSPDAERKSISKFESPLRKYIAWLLLYLIGVGGNILLT